MSQITISGHVALAETGHPAIGVRVEFWDTMVVSPPSAGTFGLITSMMTDMSGSFSANVVDPYATRLLEDGISLSCKIFKGESLIYQETTGFIYESINISIDDVLYDSDNSDGSKPADYTPLTVKGRIYDNSGRPLESVTVNIYENGFRSKTLLGFTRGDIYGKYEVTINTKSIANTNVLATRSIRVEAIDDTDAFLGSSGDIFSWNGTLIVDIQTTADRSVSEFDKLKANVNAIIGGADISGLTKDDTQKIDEARYVAGAAGYDADAIEKFVNAHKQADSLSTSAEMIYALILKTDGAHDPFWGKGGQKITDIINDAITSKTIPSFTSSEITDFIEVAKSYQIVSARNTYLPGESYTNNDVWMGVFGSETEMMKFLMLYNGDHTSIGDFWTQYETTYGSASLAKAQLGLRVASLAGQQPETVAGLMGTVGTDDFSTLAKWDVDQWKTLIAGICSDTHKLCVPAPIRGTETDPDNAAIQQLYAEKMMGIIQDIFPLTNVCAQLEGEKGTVLIPDSDVRGIVITFINNNPIFDARKHSVYDINDTDYNLTGITDVEKLKEGLLPFQRIMRCTWGNPNAVGQLITDGIDSAFAITQMSKENFIDTYGELFDSTSLSPMAVFQNRSVTATGVSASTAVYNQALNTYQTSINSTWSAAVQTSNYSYWPKSVIIGFPHYSFPVYPPYFPGGYFPEPEDNPSFTSLFGSLDYCACCDCQSMLSPSAYFTDTLHFLRTNAEPAYFELVRRRPDIVNIDLTCKNTDTPLPYIDLVNELLEIAIMTQDGVLPITPSNFSYQTNGTQEELEAFPEHIYKNGSGDYVDDSFLTTSTGYAYVYNHDLTNAVYPFNLPFSLALEEARTYLNYLGINRYDLMQLFNPRNQPVVSSSAGVPGLSIITNYSIYAELLGITQFDASIVTGAYSLCSLTPWIFYGIANETLVSSDGLPDPSDPTGAPLTGHWYQILTGRIDVLLTQTSLTYLELLELLQTDFLNKHDNILNARPISITNITGAAPDTCALDQLQLVFLSDSTNTKKLAFLNKLYRFIKLIKTNILTIYEWDVLLRSMAITDISIDTFLLIGRVLVLSKKLNLKPTVLACWWGSIDTVRYLDFRSENLNEMPSDYDRLFNNKGVINDASNTLLFNNPITLPVYTGNLSQIASYSSLRESELVDILTFLQVPYISNPSFLVSAVVLARIHWLSTMARTKNIHVRDLLKIFTLSEIPFLQNNQPFTGWVSPDSGYVPYPPATVPITWTERNYFLTDFISYLEEFTNALDATKSSGFSIDELTYIVSNQDDRNAICPDPSDIQKFLEDLRGVLRKNLSSISSNLSPDEVNATLKNTVYQQFSKEFKVPSEWLSPSSLTSGSGFIQNMITDVIADDFIDTDFINSAYDLSEAYIQYLNPGGAPPSGLPPDTVVPAFLWQLYDCYRHVFKSVYIAKKLNLSIEEFEYFYGRPDVIGFDFTQLKVDVDHTSGIFPLPLITTPYSVRADLLNGLLRLCRWIEVRNKLSLSQDILCDMLDAISTRLPIAANQTGPNPPLVDSQSTANYLENLKERFASFFSTLNQPDWGSMLADLIGTSDTITLTPNSTTGGYNFTPQGVMNMLYSSHVNLTDTALYHSDFAPTNYDSVTLILNIIDIMYWSQRIGLQPATIHKLLRADLALVDSRKLIISAKGKHTTAEWAKIAKPLRDTIRVKQRDALVGYIRTNPNYLFADLLIDVEMDACMITSRIKQAISSVQLFIDRLLLGIERDPSNNLLQLPNTAKQQWKSWRKWYRVWEANREVFMYPENWMEPELRDDKSVFFEELEAELKQDEFTDDKVFDSVMNFLQKLEDISKLEPVSVCDETVDGIKVTHTVYRTTGASHRYYYRYVKNNIWSPWERIEIDIASDHVMLVVRYGKLQIFWLTFKEKQAPATVAGMDHENDPRSYWFYNDQQELGGNTFGVDNGAQNSSPVTYYKQLEIALNWSEYKNGKWHNQRISADKLLIKLHPRVSGYVMNAVFMHWSTSPGVNEADTIFSFLMDNKEVPIVEFVKSRMFIVPGISSGDDFDVNILFPERFFYPDEVATYLHGFRFVGGSNEPQGIRNWVFDYNRHTNFPAPTGTLIKNMRFISNDTDSNSQVFVDKIVKPSDPIRGYAYLRQAEYQDIYPGVRQPFPLLGNTDHYGPFKMVGKSNSYIHDQPSDYGLSPLQDQFTFDDATNSFFIRTVSSSLQLYEAYVQPGKYDLSLTPSLWVIPNYNPIGLQTSPTTQYLFQTFYHPYAKEYIRIVENYGIDGLFKPEMQTQADGMDFNGSYSPAPIVFPQYPTNKVDFDYFGAYSSYNWELFYHMPMLIAQRLSENQQFDDAQKWFHYVFDPRSNDYLDSSHTFETQKYWKFWPLYKVAGYPVQSLNDLLILVHENSTSANDQVAESQDDPFEPYAIARMRHISFMKNTVMKYLDNLIAWGDNLFARDTIESINEATELYILAANILGPRPQKVPQRALSAVYSYREMGGLDALSNAAVFIEGYTAPNTGPVYTGNSNVHTVVPKMFYFCISPNDELLAYWDKVADRLFKIRHCENISGQVQQLPLFDPPIDPGLLVRAAAAGIDINSLLDDVSGANLPHYRFTYIVQKANEFCSDVKALGGALLSALEKKDAEQLSLLRSGQEVTLLTSVLQMKKSQLDEANANLDALSKTRDVTQEKYDYYSSRQPLNAGEQQHIQSLKLSVGLQTAQTVIQEIGNAMAMIPRFHAQGPFAFGMSFGGGDLSNAFGMISQKLGALAAINNTIGTVAATKGGYDRRMDDWQFQAESARLELVQIDKQLIAAQIRIDIAQKDFDNQQLQIDNSSNVDTFMRSKYTNEELYDWMSAQISATYFQAYQLACQMAKIGERCYANELPLSTQVTEGFIQFGNWDSLKKGLLAGEKLQFEIRNMEAAYIAENSRLLELTKHVSLAQFAPDCLMNLRQFGSCTLSIPEEIYDMDYPGHVNRLIKSMSISVPCVAGPYATIPCTLTYTGGSVRKEAFGNLIGPSNNIPCNIIATSSAQNDNGVFDFSFRDERYLPFEGAGAISNWNIQIANAPVGGTADPAFKMFDYNSIGDVILHIKYTAIDESTASSTEGTFYAAQVANLNTQIDAGSVGTGLSLDRYFSLRHEFPNDWNAMVLAGGTPLSMTIDLALDQFPFFCQGRTVAVSLAGGTPPANPVFISLTKPGAPPASSVGVALVTTSIDDLTTDGDPQAVTFTVALSGGTAISDIDDICCVVHYTVS